MTQTIDIRFMCGADFLEAAGEIYKNGADDSDQQFVPALLHDARLAHRLAAENKELREKLERVRAILGKPRSWIERDLTTRIIVHNTEARDLAELLNH